MKKTLSLFLAVLLLFFSFSTVAFGTKQTYTGITAVYTPVVKSSLLFSKKFGSNYKAAPTPIVAVDDTILFVSGVKLYKLNAKTGEEIASVKMQGSTLYATVAPLYADGKVFVALDDGIVQAFDYAAMQSLWVYTDAVGGQAISPLAYDNGYVYTGFWVSETESANYVCLRSEDENPANETENKTATWTYQSPGGFYWAGCCITDNYVIVGTDDGQKNSENNSKIIALNRYSGKEVSSLQVKGDIRSSVTYAAETNSYYVSSKAGYIYKFTMDASGNLGSLTTYTAAGAVTATPVVYGGRLYAGCQSGTAGKFIVLDARTMKEIYTCDMQGYPQASMLVSTAFEQAGGKIYIYATYNAKPGGITVFEDSPGQTAAVKTEFFTPASEMQQYCISTIAAGANGTLYYKNDSGYIFAVTEDSAVIRSAFQRIFEAIIAFFAKITAAITTETGTR